MTVLHNRVSRKELKLRVLNDATPRQTISFYLYTSIADPQAFRDQWYLALKDIGILGRIYIAREGVNAQISVPLANIDGFRNFLEEQTPFKGLRLNFAVNDDGKSFFVHKSQAKNCSRWHR
jgi:UPF0176 protein